MFGCGFEFLDAFLDRAFARPGDVGEGVGVQHGERYRGCD
jgi:hypothetical protein